MNVYTYEFVKLLNEERLRRSMANYRARSKTAEGPTTRSEPEKLADVVELTFATGCEHDSIGA